MPLASPELILRRVLSRHLRPPERLEVDEWADRHRRVVGGPVPGPWVTRFIPYLRRPMRDYTDPAVARILLMFGTQCGKTECMMNCLAYTIDQEPLPSLWVLDSRDSARDFSADRLTPTVRRSPALARHLSSRIWDTKLQRIEFDSMTLWLIGSNSAGALAQRPVGRLFLDERDKFPQAMGGRGLAEAGAVNLAYGRLGAFGAEGKAMEGCSPTIEGFGIAQEYEVSDQGRYAVPCPLCQRHQFLRFGIDGRGGVRWEGGSGSQMSDVALAVHMERVKRTACYECEHCGGAIPSSRKAWMLERGMWVRAGQDIGERGTVLGAAPITGIRGYQISQVYSPFLTFGDVAAQWVQRRGEPDQDFVNKVLGEPWRQATSRADENRVIDLATAQARAHAEEELKAQSAQASVAGPAQDPETRDPRPETPLSRERFRKGEAPIDALVLLTTIDVQKDGCFVLTMGFGEREAQFLVDFRFVACPEVLEADGGEAVLTDERLLEDHWALVAEEVGRTYPRTSFAVLPGAPGPPGLDSPEEPGRRLRPQRTDLLRASFTAIDCGDRTAEVYRFVTLMGADRCFPVKGVESQVAPIDFAAVDPDGVMAARRAQRAAGIKMMAAPWAGLNMMQIRPSYWREVVFTRLQRTAPQPGAWRYPLDFMAEGGADFARQVTAEERVLEKYRGRTRPVWRLRAGRRHNHYWDCAVYMAALAEHVGCPRLTSENLAGEQATGNRQPATGGSDAARSGLRRAAVRRSR